MQAAVTLPPDFYRKLYTCANVEPFVRHQVRLGSILLDGPQAEKSSGKNSGLDGLVLIDKIKKAGGPSYPVYLGRRDGMESKASWVDLPSPAFSINQGIAYFKSKGLDDMDYATLLGAHTMGKTHCVNLNDRLYNFNKTRKPDPSIAKSQRDELRKQCPKPLKKGRKTRPFLKVDQDLLQSYNTSQLALEYAAILEHLKQQFSLSISRCSQGTKGRFA
ncbi:hypothetical protein SASPL_133704 [Salvia splendens]|uniref:peroxidase n=1 Tax=Salvia splendens TaxID=180675 RepID=A0A8X8ZID0_SALSN|nr:hypothetical protein SASPL_133704 [Salvia splendens]